MSTCPVAVVPTGVPLELFRPGDREAARRQLGLPLDAPLCLYVGRLDREKSVDRIIDAFGAIAGAVSGVRLSLVGQGSHESATRQRAEASPARERIAFHGGLPREALSVYYRAADLFLFASETETQGLVLAEAHASGLPAVAVRASGVDEVVRDGETGLLTKPEPGEIADAAIGLLLDRERREADGPHRASGGRPRLLGGATGRGHGVALRPAPRRHRVNGASRQVRIVFQPAWDPMAAAPGHRGLFSADPRVRTLLRVLASYPEVRHVLPDQVSLDSGASPPLIETIARFLDRQSWLVRRVEID